MRLVVEDHPVTEIEGGIADHMHQAHHCPMGVIRCSTTEELNLWHADDHDDLRRGIDG